jgi:hypothetical protein
LSRFVAAGTIPRGTRSVVSGPCWPASTAVCLIRAGDHERCAALAPRGVEAQTRIIGIIGQSIVAGGHWHLDVLGFTAVNDVIIDAIGRGKRTSRPPFERVEARLPRVRIVRLCPGRTGR